MTRPSAGRSRGPDGGGLTGDPSAHEDEAPVPEAVAEFVIQSPCRPGGIMLDPSSGSGTSVAVARRPGRDGIGLDFRRDQAGIARRRIDHPHSPSPRHRRGDPKAASAIRKTGDAS